MMIQPIRPIPMKSGIYSSRHSLAYRPRMLARLTIYLEQVEPHCTEAGAGLHVLEEVAWPQFV